MKFFAAFALAIAFAVAMPTGDNVLDADKSKPKPAKPLCTAGKTPLCCEASVLGLAALTCKTLPHIPKNDKAFKILCHNNGDTAQCCDAPILGEALGCSAAE